MFQKLCSYLDTVILSDHKTCQLEQYKISQSDHGCWQMDLLTAKPARLDSTTHVQASVQAIENVHNASTGLYEPFVFSIYTRSSHAGPITESLTIAHWNASSQAANEHRIVLDKTMEFSKCSLCSGPSLVYYTNSTLHITFPLCGDAQSLVLTNAELQRSTSLSRTTTGQRCRKAKVTSIANVWSFDWTCCEGLHNTASSSLLLFIKCSSSSSHFLVSKIVSLTCEGGVVCAPAPSLCELPQEYASIINCLSMSLRVSFDAVTSARTLSPVFTLGTRYNQLVLIERATIIHCIETTTTPSRIISLNPQTSEGLAVVYQSEEQDASLVSLCLSSKQTWEQTKWKDVRAVVKGDFLNTGHEQLLCLFKAQGHFAITDFNGLSYGSTDKVVKSSVATTEPPKALLTALNALQVRQLQGEVHLMDTRMELQRKIDLLCSALKLVTQFGEETSSMQHCDQSLQCVIPGMVDPPRHLNVSAESRCFSSDLLLCSHWQRIVDNQWVIAVVVRNSSNDPMQDLSLSLSSSGGQQCPISSEARIVSVSTCSSTTGSPSHSPQRKKRKLSHEDINGGLLLPAKNNSALPGEATACYVLRTPLCSPSLTAAVIATWCVEGEDRHHGKVKTTRIIDFNVSVDDVCSGKFSCLSSHLHSWNGDETLPMCDDTLTKQYKDLACLVGGREVAKVLVSSTSTDLTTLPGMLGTILPSDVLIVGHSNHKTVAPSSPLAGCAVHCWSQPQRATLSILHSGQIAMILQLLSTTLPHDVCLEESSDTAAVVSALTSLRDRLGQLVHL